MDKRPADRSCNDEQDHALVAYANSFAMIRILREDPNPTLPMARGHQLDPSAFGRIRAHCRSVYTDHGSRDARMLGPCMSAATGGDYFGVMPVE